MFVSCLKMKFHIFSDTDTNYQKKVTPKIMSFQLVVLNNIANRQTNKMKTRSLPYAMDQHVHIIVKENRLPGKPCPN